MSRSKQQLEWSQRQPRCAVMFDFDGTLCDMRPFVLELEDDAPDRWGRFFAHTPEAAAVDAGLELLNRVCALGWRYSVSTTRDPRFRPLVLQWLADHRPEVGPQRKPVMVLARAGGRRGLGPALGHKARHGRRRYDRGGRPLETILFVDDEQDMVDGLTDLEVPAVHLDELAGLGDTELVDLLEYSRRAWRKRWAETQAAAAVSEPPSVTL